MKRLGCAKGVRLTPFITKVIARTCTSPLKPKRVIARRTAQAKTADPTTPISGVFLRRDVSQPDRPGLDSPADDLRHIPRQDGRALPAFPSTLRSCRRSSRDVAWRS